MQNVETPQDQTSVPSFDAPASDTSFAAGLGPVGWGLIVSAVAGAAAVPVLTAAIGEVEHFGLIVYPSMLIGGIVGFSGLLIAGLASNALKAWRRARTDAAKRRASQPEPMPRGQLAMD